MESEMKPVHPGAVLREDILKEMNISVTWAAKELNVSRKQLSEVVNETAAVSAEMAVRLESGFGVSAEFWLDMQKKYDIWHVRKSGRVQNVGRILALPKLELKRGSGKGNISRVPDNFTDELIPVD